MDVRKTNGSFEEYDKAKLARGIHEAYKTAGEYCDDAIVVSIINNLYVYEGITSQEIRRQVEESLMSVNKKVALAYIEKFDADLDLRKKRDFIKDYIKASNAATGSKFDANANVTRKNIVTLGNELYKENNIKQNRYIMQDKIKSLYGRAMADQYIKDLESHILYKHDESGTPGFPYCVAITMYPFLVSGLKDLGGVSIAPTDLKSFCGEFINLVYSVSSQFMGAVATPEFLMYLDYFIRKDYGDDYLEHLNDVVENNVKQRTLVKVIDNYFQQVVHSMNMPAGNRGYQTVFWNIGYFDKPYFQGVFGDFYFPDGTQDTLVRAVLKTASGNSYGDARYYDSPGYFFDVTVGEGIRFDSFVREIRLALCAGFLCWQTDNGRQNDAVQAGLLASLDTRWFTLGAELGGYAGWEHDGDRPVRARVRLDIHPWRAPVYPFAQACVGLHDYPFTQFRAGLAWCFRR